MKKALIVLIALAFVAAFAMPAAAADKTEWGFYGSARMTTFSYDSDKENPALFSGAVGYPAVPNRGINGFDDRDTIWNMQGNSRFGATAKAGAVSGHVEIRETAEFRIMWGEWDFGVGKLGVGKHYTPANLFYSNASGFGAANLLAMGGYYSGADGMIRLRFQGIADMIDFDLAFVEPSALQAYGAGEDTGTAYVGNDQDTTLPQIEARMLFNWGSLQLELGGAWVEVENTQVIAGAERSYDIEAWTAVMGIKYAMGPFSFKGSVFTGDNNSVAGQWLIEACVPVYDAVNDTIIDRDAWGWQAIFGFKLNDMLAFEGGYGETETEYNQVNTFDDDLSAWYVQAVITPAAGVVIIPEVGEVDYEDNGQLGPNNDEGDVFYFGAEWRISF